MVPTIPNPQAMLNNSKVYETTTISWQFCSNLCLTGHYQIFDQWNFYTWKSIAWLIDFIFVNFYIIEKQSTEDKHNKKIIMALVLKTGSIKKKTHSTIIDHFLCQNPLQREEVICETDLLPIEKKKFYIIQLVWSLIQQKSNVFKNKV